MTIMTQQGFFKALLSTSIAASIAASIAITPVFAITPDSLTHYKNGVNLERQGQLQEAESEFRQAMATDPDDQLTIIKLASILVQLGRPNESIALYKRALTLGSQDPMIYFSLGAVYEQQGDYANAEQAYQRGVTNNPQYIFGHFTYGRMLVQLAKYADASAHYETFLKAYPEHFDARRQLAHLYLVNGQQAQATQEYEYLKNNSPNRFTDYVNLARALNQSNEPQKALEELKTALAREGDKSEIAEEMGIAHRTLGQTAFAIQHFQKALALNSGKTYLHLTLGELYETAHQNQNAIAHYHKYLSIKPDDRIAREALAHVFLEEGMYSPAIDEYSQVLSVLPVDNDAAHSADRFRVEKQLAYSYQLSGDLEQAVPRYEELLRKPLGDGDLQLKSNLAIAYHKQGNLDSAVALYKDIYNIQQKNPGRPSAESLALTNDLANALVALGEKAYKEGNLDAALEKYTEAGEYAQPSNILPKLGLANVYYFKMETAAPDKQGEFERKAYRAYETVLLKDPNNEVAQLYIAKLDLRSNNLIKALPVLEALAKRQPGSVEVTAALAEAYSKKGDHAGSLKLYQQALAGKTNDENLLLAIGNEQQQLARTDKTFYQEAIKTYETARAINPNNALVRYNLGVIYSELGRNEESAVEYRMALMLDPDLSDALYGLAVTLEKQQDLKEAYTHYQRYLDLPNAPYQIQARERVELIKTSLGPDNLPAPAPPVRNITPEATPTQLQTQPQPEQPQMDSVPPVQNSTESVPVTTPDAEAAPAYTAEETIADPAGVPADDPMNMLMEADPKTDNESPPPPSN